MVFKRRAIERDIWDIFVDNKAHPCAKIAMYKKPRDWLANFITALDYLK